MSKITNDDLTALELMFLDTFPEEGAALCNEHGCKLTTLAEPVEVETPGARYETNGQYEITVKKEK